MAMKLADYAITEAGFGADLGAEKFHGYQSAVWQVLHQVQLLS